MLGLFAVVLLGDAELLLASILIMGSPKAGLIGLGARE
jgi:hypothetical protein